MMGGPIVGQVFYSAFGFSGCFYSTAFLIFGSGLLAIKFIPGSINKDKMEK